VILRALFFKNNEELGEKGILGQPPRKDENRSSSFLYGRGNQEVQGQAAVSLLQPLEADGFDSHLSCFELQYPSAHQPPPFNWKELEEISFFRLP
jgi:hypothetical protein